MEYSEKVPGRIADNGQPHYDTVTIKVRETPGMGLLTAEQHIRLWELLRAAYAAGFNNAGEGYNATQWAADRDAALTEILSSTK